jgi:hypothetical protein
MWICPDCRLDFAEEPEGHECDCERIVWYFNEAIEREIATWLSTLEGKFAAYCARRALARANSLWRQ